MWDKSGVDSEKGRMNFLLVIVLCLAMWILMIPILANINTIVHKIIILVIKLPSPFLNSAEVFDSVTLHDRNPTGWLHAVWSIILSLLFYIYLSLTSSDPPVVLVFWDTVKKMDQLVFDSTLHNLKCFN